MVKSKKKKSSSSYVALQFKTFCYGVMIFLLALGMIFNYALLTQTKMEMNSLRREINAIEKQKEDILVVLETVKNTNYIEEMAMNFLGMDYASSHQSYFVSINDAMVHQDGFAYDKDKDKMSFESIVERTIAFLKNEGM